jgi:hypothetical protein
MELFKLFGTIAINNDEANDAIDDTAGKGEEAESRLSKAFGKIAAAVAAAFAIDKIISFGKEVVNMAAEVSAEVSAFEQIMGDYSDEASAKVAKIAEATGMVDTRLTPYMTSMTAKFKGLGYDVEDATDYAARGLNLAADAAAFWDKSLDESMSHLNSFINGSYEGGEAIGLFANDTQMAAYAVEQGIVSETKAWAELDEATKQATRLQYAENMFEMSGATGQAAKEADQYANVQANLTEKWRQFKAQIGEPLLQNVVLPAMEKLSGIVDIASQKFEELKTWISENQTTIQVLIGVIAGLTAGIIAYNAVLMAMEVKTKAAAAAQWLLNAAQNANPIGLIISAIAALVAAFIYLWNNSEEFRNFWIGLWEKIKSAALAVAEWFSSTWQAVSDWFVNLWNGIKETVSTVWEGIKNAVRIGLEIIGSLISAAWQIITLPFRFIWENCKEYVFAAWEWIKEKVSTAINVVSDIITTVWTAVSGFFSTIWNGIKNTVGGAWDWISEKVSTAINKIKSIVTTVFNAVKSVVTTVWNAIKNAISVPINAAKSLVSSVVNGIKSTVSSVFNGVKSSVTTVWDGIKNAIKKPIEAARDLVKGAIDKIKGFFDFDFKWPKLKMPHFGISPSGWKIGDLLKGSIPKLSIEWYAKAMNNPMIMTRPTLFGYNSNGELMAGGEAGPEVVSGVNTLMGMIRSNIRNEISGTEQRLETLISMLAEYMPELVSNSSKQIVLNNGVLVGELASGMDSRLGEINRLRERGR